MNFCSYRKIVFYNNIENIYTLLGVLLSNIAEYFYELCRILTSPYGESKYKKIKYKYKCKYEYK